MDPPEWSELVGLKLQRKVPPSFQIGLSRNQWKRNNFKGHSSRKNCLVIYNILSYVKAWNILEYKFPFKGKSSPYITTTSWVVFKNIKNWQLYPHLPSKVQH